VTDAVKAAAAVMADYGRSTRDQTASLGSINISFGQTERKFMAMLEEAPDLRPDMVMIPMDIDGKMEMHKIAILGPHKVFHHLFLKGKLREWAGMSTSDLEAFWVSATRAPWGQYAKNIPVSMYGRTVPLRIHGDDAESWRDTPLTVISCASFSPGKLVRLLVAVIPKNNHWRNDGKDVTLQVIGKYLAWSIAQLQCGRFAPTEFGGQNPQARGGELIANGMWRAVYTMSTGDLVYLLDFYGWDTNHRRNLCCAFCGAARKGELAYYNPLGDAPWLATLMSTTQYKEVNGWSGLCHLPGWDISSVAGDLMHLVYIGLGEDVAGEAVMCLAREGNWSADQVVGLWVQFKTWCREQRLPLPRGTYRTFTIPFARKKAFPHISTFKATCMRSLLAFLAYREYRDPEVGAAVVFLHTFLQTLNRAGMWLSEGETETAVAAGTAFLTVWVSAAYRSLEAKIPRFKIRVKHHNFLHGIVRLHQDHLNMRMLSCFGAEGFVGDMSRLSSRVHPRTVTLRCIERFLLHIRMFCDE
jgi:hypothetical protein